MSHASAFDLISTAKIDDLISELKRDYTIVIVTHNMRAGSESVRLHRVFPSRRDDRAWKDEADLRKSGKEEYGRLYHRKVWIG